MCFYSKKTLEFIAKKFGWNFFSLDGNFHIFADKSIDLQGALKKYFRMLKKKSFAKKVAQKIFFAKKFESLVWHDFLEQQEKLKS